MHASGDSYGPLLGYLVLDLLGAAQDFLSSRVPDGAHNLFVARPNDLLGKILAHFYLQAFPQPHGWELRAHDGAAHLFADPT